MFNGGSQFWEWFINQVAHKVAIDVNTRVLEELKNLSNYEYLFPCDYCHLPASFQCYYCNFRYCNRTYYCKSKNGFSCDECGACNDCHDICVICKVKVCTEGDIAGHRVYVCNCVIQHIYCSEHIENMSKCDDYD